MGGIFTAGLLDYLPPSRAIDASEAGYIRMNYWKGYRNRLRREFTWRSFVGTLLLIFTVQILSLCIEYMGAPRWLSSLAGLIIVLGAVILANQRSR